MRIVNGQQTFLKLELQLQQLKFYHTAHHVTVSLKRKLGILMISSEDEHIHCSVLATALIGMFAENGVTLNMHHFCFENTGDSEEVVIFQPGLPQRPLRFRIDCVDHGYAEHLISTIKE